MQVLVSYGKDLGGYPMCNGKTLEGFRWGASLEDHLPAGEIENGWEKGDIEVSSPVRRLRQI